MKYLLIDTANTFFRARHSAHRASDTWTKLGFALHVTLMAVNKVARRFEADHVIFALEGRSWRKDFYSPYKRNRTEARAALTEKEAEEDKLFWETFDKFKEFIIEKTNCTVLQNPQLEADDLIAGWIKAHPNDNHIVVSTDSDLHQLVAPNVSQYNGVEEHLITTKGYFDDKDQPVKDKKTGVQRVIPTSDWIVFEKSMRGDATDNVFSAYPRVRKTALMEAYNDRDRKGFKWNNLMLQKWVDHDGKEHVVKDDYERNRILIDLNAQPDDVKIKMFECIDAATKANKDIAQIGTHLLKFCGKWNLQKMSDQITQYSPFMSAKYD